MGPGGVIRLVFEPALGVAAETDVTLNVEVGAAAPFSQLRVSLKLRP